MTQMHASDEVAIPREPESVGSHSENVLARLWCAVGLVPPLEPGSRSGTADHEQPSLWPCSCALSAVQYCQGAGATQRAQRAVLGMPGQQW
jgi:hypothetical protein